MSRFGHSNHDSNLAPKIQLSSSKTDFFFEISFNVFNFMAYINHYRWLCSMGSAETATFTSVN